MNNIEKLAIENRSLIFKNNQIVTTLVETLNHKVSQIEIDIKWMRRVGYYMAGIVTAIAIKLMFIGG